MAGEQLPKPLGRRLAWGLLLCVVLLAPSVFPFSRAINRIRLDGNT